MLRDNTTVSFMGSEHCSYDVFPAMITFKTNSMLLWWTLDSIPLLLVIKRKVGNSAT